MSHFLFDVALNLALLALVQIACCLHNRLTSGPAINGARVFAALALFALLFDAALTFLVFADAQTRYGQFSSRGAFIQRTCACGLTITVALLWRFFARRSRVAQTSANKPVVINTSPYSESNLHM